MLAARLRSRRPVKQLSGAVAALIVVAILGAGSSAPAVAASAAPAVSVWLTPADSGDLDAGEDLRIVVDLSNSTTAATPDAVADVAVGPAPFAARSTLADWFSGRGKSTPSTQPVGTATVPAVPAGAGNQVAITIPAASLPFGAPGVYPVSVSVTSGSTVVGTARSAVAWGVAPSAAVPVAIAAPLTVPAGESEFLTSNELATYTGPDGVLTRELDDIEGSPIAIGIDPRIVASIRILGKSAPTTATDWLNQLAAVSNQTFPLAWADADVTAPLHAGRSSVLETKSLDYAIDPSLFPATTNPSTPVPTPTATPSPSPVPTTASLVAWNYTLPALSWPAENSVVNADLGKLNAAGLTDAILSSTNVTTGDNRGLTGATARVDHTDVAISDAVLSGYLRTAIQSTTRETSAEATTELSTSLALISLESGAAPNAVLLTLGRNWAAADTNFERSITTTYARPWTSVATLSSVFAAPPVDVKIVNKTESADRIALVGSMLAGEQGVVGFAPIAVSPDALTSGIRLRLLSVLSNEWTATAWRTAAAAYVSETAKIVRSVQVDPSSEIVVFADQTALPMNVSNNLDQDVTVTLTVRSTTPLVSVDRKFRAQSLTVAAGSQRRIQIPIQALSNGKAKIVASLVSSTGVSIGRTVTIKVNVQAGWETIGTLIFAALVVGLFLFGIIRSIRKRRKARSSE